MTPTELLDNVAACLCVAIEEADVPDVCFCGVVPGDGVVAEYAGCVGSARQGMAWVRMTALYPASGLNQVDERPNNCPSAVGMDLEVGMLRPVPGVDARGNPPTAEQYRSAGDLLSRDAMLMWRALNCCEALGDIDTLLGTFTPAGPEGGLVGGTWPLAVLF